MCCKMLVARHVRCAHCHGRLRKLVMQMFLECVPQAHQELPGVQMLRMQAHAGLCCSLVQAPVAMLPDLHHDSLTSERARPPAT